MVAAGLSPFLLRLGILGLAQTRKELSLRYLPKRATGIEIGASHSPLPLPGGAVARYVDCYEVEELRTFNPDASSLIFPPDLIADGFSLDCIISGSQDFVIANHVLEHATDALGTLLNWVRVLRPGGVLFVAVPIGARCFDRGRSITRLDHFVEDRRLTELGDRQTMYKRNCEHIEEYLRIAAPALARANGTSWKDLSRDAWNREVERLVGQDSHLVHHHVFSSKSFSELLGLLGQQTRIECIATSSVEIVGIVRRVS